MQDGKVGAIDVKNFLGYKDAASFAADWKLLTPADKTELQDSLQKLYNEGKWKPA